jgi:RNA recognition motif-containing protein
MNLYVGNLDFEITEEEIKILFEQVGDVASVRLMKDKETGRSKGFAFVQMDDTEEAVIALKTLNGREFHGRNIVVNQGTEGSDNKKSSGSDNRSRDRKPYGDGPRKSFGDGERRSFKNNERRPYDGERKPYSGERKPYDRPSGNVDRRPYDSANTTRKPFDGEKRPSDNSSGGIKRPIGESSKRPRISDKSEDKKIQPRDFDADANKRFNDED